MPMYRYAYIYNAYIVQCTYKYYLKIPFAYLLLQKLYAILYFIKYIS